MTSPSRTGVLAFTVFTRGKATSPSSIKRWICEREKSLMVRPVEPPRTALAEDIEFE
jgi:hypothetical protein